VILKTFIVIALLVAGVLIAAAFKPNTYRIQRSIGLQALPEKIFPLLDDLQNWSRLGSHRIERIPRYGERSADPQAVVAPHRNGAVPGRLAEDEC
jgi:hypothetical protein